MLRIDKYRALQRSIFCLIILVGCLALGYGETQATTLSDSLAGEQEERIRQQLDRLYEVIAYLEEYHVDNPTSEELIEDALYGIFLFMDDPYTTYMEEVEYDEFIHSINGAFVGIGVFVELTERGVVIQGVLPRSPAAKAGLKMGDLIREVDGGLIEGHSIEEATDAILGEEGTEVEVIIEREVDGVGQTFTYTLIREKVSLPHVEVELLNRHTAHLKLYRFGADTYDIIKRELQRLEKMNIEKVILDLRGNSGGLLDSVMAIASLFRESGVILHSKDSTGRLIAHEIREGNRWDIPMVVLIDYSTASAAEVLAGFLQDYELATVIGEDSFGKGRVQTSINLEHGGILHLSIEEYFTPRMNKVDFEGIHPDIYVHDPILQVAKAYGWLNEMDEMALYADGQIRLNGLADKQFSQYAFQHEGKWFLSLRMLSDWYAGAIEWDWEKESIDLELLESTYHFEKDSSALRIVDDRAYIELDYIKAYMPLEVLREDDRVLLRQKKLELVQETLE